MHVEYSEFQNCKSICINFKAFSIYTRILTRRVILVLRYRFGGKYVTGIGKRFQPYKAYIFLIMITRRVDLAMSVRPSVHMSVEISKTITASMLGLRMNLSPTFIYIL